MLGQWSMTAFDDEYNLRPLLRCEIFSGDIPCGDDELIQMWHPVRTISVVSLWRLTLRRKLLYIFLKFPRFPINFLIVLIHLSSPFPWFLQCLTKLQICCISSNKQVWSFPVHRLLRICLRKWKSMFAVKCFAMNFHDSQEVAYSSCFSTVFLFNFLYE